MPRSGPRAVRKYSDDFKLTAVRLSQQSGLQVKTVAAALAIHPFMLSKCARMCGTVGYAGERGGRHRQVPRVRSHTCRHSRRRMRCCKRSTNS